jgi:flagellar biosynthetic protein FliR
MTRILLIGARVSSMLVFAPVFGGHAVPARIKAGLTFVLSAFLYPVYAPKAVDITGVAWVSVLFSEMAVGLLIGLTMQFVFEGVQLGAQLMGFQIGFSLVNVIDPQTQVDTPVLAVFQQSIAILIFLQLNVHHWILRGLAKSFEYLPPATFSVSTMAAQGFLKTAGGMLLIGIQLAAPILMATMLTDVALGFIGRAAPQIPVLFMGISLKNLLGMALLLGTMTFWPNLLERHFVNALSVTEQLLHLSH